MAQRKIVAARGRALDARQPGCCIPYAPHQSPTSTSGNHPFSNQRLRRPPDSFEPSRCAPRCAWDSWDLIQCIKFRLPTTSRSMEVGVRTFSSTLRDDSLSTLLRRGFRTGPQNFIFQRSSVRKSVINRTPATSSGQSAVRLPATEVTASIHQISFSYDHSFESRRLIDPFDTLGPTSYAPLHDGSLSPAQRISTS